VMSGNQKITKLEFFNEEVDPDKIAEVINDALKESQKVAAKKLQDLVRRATGRQSDGVIFITTPGLKLILESTGAVTTKSGNQLTAINLNDQAVFSDYSDNNSGQRNDALEDVANGLHQLISTNKAPDIILGVLRAIDQEELFIASANPEIAKTLELQSANGAIRSVTCPEAVSSPANMLSSTSTKPLCLKNSIMVVDANVGINKADYFLHKEHEVEVSIRDDLTTETTLKLTYQNLSPPDTRLDGTYKGYVRVIMPANTHVHSLVEQTLNSLIDKQTDRKLEEYRKKY